MYQLGFIGVGNMGGALARAAVAHTSPKQILVSNRTADKAVALATDLGCIAATPETVAGTAKFIFLGVKPKDMSGCLTAIEPMLAGREGHFVLVSMAAGLDTAAIQRLAGHSWPVIRLCPNTPVGVGRGLIAWCERDTDPADAPELIAAMAGAGTWDACPEELMDIASVIGGCTPAFTYMFIEALADGAVACGMPRTKAMTYAAAAVEGAAALAQADGRHPGALKDAVCSPGGSTIRGVLALEEGAFRSAAAKAVMAAVALTRDMGK